jgi:hypothetical protein
MGALDHDPEHPTLLRPVRYITSPSLRLGLVGPLPIFRPLEGVAACRRGRATRASAREARGQRGGRAITGVY